MARRKTFFTDKVAASRGFYDEYPMLPPGVDPQVHLSRNDRVQPFFLICEKDTVLVQMSGKANVEFRGADVERFDLSVGDIIYVPAGTPHRIAPESKSTQYRYKAEHAGKEGVSWYCECGSEIRRYVWDTDVELSQDAYLKYCTEFNDNSALRTCEACGRIHPPVDISENHWAEVAQEIRMDLEDA